MLLIFESNRNGESGSGKLNNLHLRGEVFSGSGEGSRYMAIDWVKGQMEEKLGFKLFPGTLNVKLTEESVNVRKLLKKEVGFEVLPVSGYCHGRFFKAAINGVECAVIVPDVLSYPENVAEVVAPINLREKLSLADGSMVEVEVML